MLLYMACCCHCELYRYSFLLLLLGSRCFFRSFFCSYVLLLPLTSTTSYFCSVLLLSEIP